MTRATDEGQPLAWAPGRRGSTTGRHPFAARAHVGRIESVNRAAIVTACSFGESRPRCGTTSHPENPASTHRPVAGGWE